MNLLNSLKPVFSNSIKLFYPILILCILYPQYLKADIDLDFQRGEKQDIWLIPGHKEDHNGIILNPTPQEITILASGNIDISKGFKLKTSGFESSLIEKDAQHIGLKLNGKGVPVKINISQEKINKNNEFPGGYKLTVTPKDIAITADDDTGAYYGLLTLHQLAQSPAAKEGVLPCMVISDYPNMKYRGLVEGFYGTPWSHEARMSLIEFMGKNKMNYYIFGPKDDPYHSSPYWRLPYPTKEAERISELVKTANNNHVNFVWAIHPGKDIRWDKADYDSLVNKFEMMYNLGVRNFAIFFDDIEGIGTDSHRQAALVNDLTRDFVDPKGDVGNIMICPTDYSQLWANPGENGQLAIYGRELTPRAEVFWTGEFVCSDLNHKTLDFVDSRIQRPALYWWNYPVTDYARNFLLQGPVYGLDPTLTSTEVAGVVSNPMEHGEASKLALYGVGDYTWNSKDYNPIDNWERGIKEIVPDATEAYRRFAIHNGDTKTGYRRDESWETKTFRFDNYTPQEYDDLLNEFTQIQKTPDELEKISNKALLNEIHPWLIEFGKLGERGVKALELLKIYESGNDSLFLRKYSENLMTEEDKKAYNAHKVGTLKLQPFYETIMEDMITDYYKKNPSGQPKPQTNAYISVVDYVDPFIGTTNYGATHPGAVMPNGMMSVTPFNVMGSDINPIDKDSRWWSAPYDHGNKFFTGYAHVNLSGVGCPDLGGLLTIATSGDLEPDYHKYGSEYTEEVAVPGYYSNKLAKYDILTEATATKRSSVERYTFNEGGQGNILLNLGEGLTNESGASIKKINDMEVEGYKLMGTFCYAPQKVYPIYFVAKVNKKPSANGYWKKQRVMEGPEANWDPDNGKYKLYTEYSKELSGDDIGYWWTFDDIREGEQIELRMGVSFVSMKNARENMEKEQIDLPFDALRTLASQEWEKELGKIRVKGGTEDQKTIFYTGLYHALMHPSLISDINGEYPKFESSGTGKSSYDHYTVFSLWDTSRNLHQLLTLVYPEKQIDMLRSLADMASSSGWLPRWELYGREMFTMEGDPVIPMIVDSWQKGLRDFPLGPVYRAMRRSATTPGKDNIIRPDIDFYIEKGYIPYGYYSGDMSGDNSVSHALEYYVADNALANLAEEIGQTEFAQQLRKRAQGWKNYYSQESGTMRPLDADGKFLTPFDPRQGENFETVTGFHEGSAWNYTFYVPHDIEGLAELMGGDSIFIEKLQMVFDNDLYDPTNEPDIAYPYLFSRFNGEEWRTTQEVDRLLKKYYGTRTNGIPGNDDTGTMSAWAIFSMMGFYPDAPGEPYYTLTAPTFDEIEIDIKDGETIKISKSGEPTGPRRIESMRLGDKTLNKYRISHKELLDGKNLHFNISSR